MCQFSVLIEKLPVVCRDIDLVSGATPQVLQGILLYCGADLSSFPIAELRFIVDRVSVDRCVVGGMWAQFHCQGVSGGGGKGYLR